MGIGTRLATVLALALIVGFAPAAFAVCGDGVIQPAEGETCEDDPPNTVGGDGCAANCTLETVRRQVLDPDVSKITIQTTFIPLPPLNVNGEVTLITGQPGLDGNVPVVVPADSIRVDPIPLLTLGCICVRGVVDEEFGPGNAGAGTIGCGAAGLPEPDQTIARDHNIGEGLSAEECMALGGTLDEAHPGVCNGAEVLTTTGMGRVGDGRITINLGLDVIADPGVACEPDDNPCGEPSDQEQITRSVGTTGRVTVELQDAANEPDNTLEAEVAGVPFDCRALRSTSGGEGAILASGGTQLDLEALGRFIDVTLTTTLGAPPRCGGDCNGNRNVTADELVLITEIMFGHQPLAACERADNDFDGEVFINDLVAAVKHSRNDCADCGNYVIQGDEECDDGNTVGGDGCAANCTEERTARCVLSAESRATTQFLGLAVALSGIGGEQTFRVGKARPSEGTGRIPVAVRPEDIIFQPLPTQFGCACVRGVAQAQFGGNAGVGSFGCGSGGLPSVSYLALRDHVTNDVDPECTKGHREVGGGSCDNEVCVGGANPGATCGRDDDCNDPHPGDCNGPLVRTFTGGGPPGSALLNAAISISLLDNNAQCAEDPFEPQNGDDGLPCTEDDPNQAGANITPLSTGTVEGRMIEANSGRSIIGKLCQDPEEGTIPCQCGGRDCIVEEVGTPLAQCSLLDTDPAAAVSDLGLAGAAAFFHQALGDLVLTMKFVCD